MQLAAEKAPVASLEIRKERADLYARLAAELRGMGRPDTKEECDKFLVFLKNERRGYVPSHDGLSPLMAIVDDWAALDAEEKAEQIKLVPE